MAIMSRIVRIFRADIHGVMDQLEDQGLLLKQYLREMAEELTIKEAGLTDLRAARTQFGRDRERLSREIEQLEDDVTAAVTRDKDDIARMLIRKQKSLTASRNEIDRQLENLDEEIREGSETVESQGLAYEELKAKAVDFMHRTQKRDWYEASALAGVGASPSDEEVELELIRRKAALEGGEA
jgi:phage shock protein A